MLDGKVDTTNPLKIIDDLNLLELRLLDFRQFDLLKSPFGAANYLPLLPILGECVFQKS